MLRGDPEAPISTRTITDDDKMVMNVSSFQTLSEKRRARTFLFHLLPCWCLWVLVWSIKGANGKREEPIRHAWKNAWDLDRDTGDGPAGQCNGRRVSQRTCLVIQRRERTGVMQDAIAHQVREW